MVYRWLSILNIILLILIHQDSVIANSYEDPIDSLKSLIVTCDPYEKPLLYLQLVKEIRNYTNNKDSIIHYLEQAHIAADLVNDHKSNIESLRLLASQYGKIKEYDKSENFFEKAFMVAQQHDEKLGLADLNYAKALYYQSKAEHEGFVHHILKAIDLYDELKQWNNKGKSLISLGVVYAGLKEIDLALEKLREAKMLEQYFTPNVQLYLNLHLGKNYRRLALSTDDDSLMQQAISILEQGKEKAKSQSNNARRGEFCLALLDSYSLRNPPIYRYDLAEEAVKIGEQTKDHFLEYQGYLGKAQMYVKEAKYQQAFAIRSLMEEAVNNLSNPVYQKSFNEINYEISKGLSRNREALFFLEKFKILNDSILDVERTSQFNEIVEKYENEKNQNEILSLSEEKEKLVIQNELSKSQVRVRSLLLGVVAILGLSGIGLVYLFQRQKRSEAENRSLQIEQQLLRAQMNPHFIFNSLNGIKRFYIEGRMEDANDFLADFSKLLRLILDRSDHTEISVEGEVEFLKLYLELEKRRLSDKLEYEINFDPESFDYDDIIPSFIVQPLVENAIWHGLKKKDGLGNIKIDVFKNGDKIYFRIMDNGVGLNGTEKSSQLHKSKGLKLIRERLGNRGSLELIDMTGCNKKYNGTMASLEIQLD